ncbi:MAG: hypothetical protein Q7R41_09230 [Phycisphaerales bacterium]|nr:hypothetical protein [Phycisphaerales bacterium]
MNGALSPAGEKHPGEIVHEDSVDRRMWKRTAAEVPLSIAWAKLNGKWIPVVRIVITGTSEHREMTSYGPGGQFLQRSTSR